MSIVSAEWTDENTRIVVELFVKQVRAGNMPSTHLTPNAYDEVGKEFLMRTGLEYTQKQVRNKWDKLKREYNTFKKLKLRETGGGWDFEKNTVKQDNEWWKKARVVSSHAYVSHKKNLNLSCFLYTNVSVLYNRTSQVVASSRGMDFIMKKACASCLRISALMAVTIGTPHLAYLPPLVQH
jgi:hypothetical protein